MTEEQYILLVNRNKEIKSSMLQNQENRTLIYGYDLNRNTFHLYFGDGEFRMVLYGRKNEIIYSYSKTSIIIYKDMIWPDKRIYPECSDFEFCTLLQQMGCELPFTNFDAEHNKMDDLYWGLEIEEWS